MKIKAKFITFWSLLLIVLSGAASPQSTDFSQKSKPATVKVLLQQQAPELVLEAKGQHDIYNPFDGTLISRNTFSRKHTLAQDYYGNPGDQQPCIKWGEKFPHRQLRFVPRDSQSAILVNGIQYRGCIEVFMNDGKFNVINEVDVESYLKSTLSVAFPQSLPEEALNAIAIVARTHAYFLGEKQPQAFWHVTAHDVGYQGAAFLPKSHVEKAVENTRHAVLTFNGAPFAATWTQNSAGKTADFAAIFRKSLTTPSGVTAPIAAKARSQSQWTCALSKSLLAHATDLSQVTGIDLYVAPQSEKVYAVKVTGDAQVKDFDFITFQKIIGTNKLRSNDFTVKTQGDQLIFTGYGEGPGVGLCLYSAKILAEKGEKAPQILEAFFPQTRLEKVKSFR